MVGPFPNGKIFFTSQKAMDRYKDKLRYVVARWGYSPHIAALEFFNEIDNGVFTPQDSVGYLEFDWMIGSLIGIKKLGSIMPLMELNTYL